MHEATVVYKVSLAAHSRIVPSSSPPLSQSPEPFSYLQAVPERFEHLPLDVNDGFPERYGGDRWSFTQRPSLRTCEGLGRR